MTPAEVMVLWLYAAELWPNYPLPASGPRPGGDAAAVRLEAWMDQVGDLPAAAVRAALNDPALAGRDWFPPLGLVRRHACLAAALAAGEALPPDEDRAWVEITGQALRIGGSGRPAWSHPAVAESVAAIGWRDLCASENLDAVRAHWRAFYAAAARRATAALVPAPPAAALAAGDVPRAVGPACG